MTRPPLKSIEEYVKTGGWASHRFIDHAEALLNDPKLVQIAKFELDKNVLYLRSGGTLLNFSIHKDGRAREYLSITNGANQQEIAEFGFSVSSEEIIHKVYKILRVWGVENEQLD